MIMNSTIELKHLLCEHKNTLNSFTLPEEQSIFTALPDSITDLKEGQHGIVIINMNEPVGFFLLHATERVKEYSKNPNAMLLTALSLNHIHQGKGYAKKGMLLLSSFVKQEFPNCNEIVLVVNHKNVAAQNLYLNVGFIDTGERKIGQIGEQILMTLAL
ncbi:MAG: GNAT family N-acetyltransferase [Solibacillus sp.]